MPTEKLALSACKIIFILNKVVQSNSS